MNKENNNLPSTILERLVNGILKENPTFVLLLGMCPTLAVTTSAVNGLGMGLSTMVVLALSNMLISALRKIIPNKVRIPSFIVIIASFVTIVELLLKAYIPFLYDNLGLYIPLIVVNCIILGRAEAYAYSNPVLPSLFDGIGMGLGFSLALTIIGGVREILGAGEIFGYHIMPASYVPVSIFVMAPGAFFVLAILTAIQNAVKISGEKKGKDMSKIQSGCGGNCLDCEKDCKKPEVVKASSANNETVKADDKETDIKSSKASAFLGKLKSKKDELKNEDLKISEVEEEKKDADDKVTSENQGSSKESDKEVKKTEAKNKKNKKAEVSNADSVENAPSDTNDEVMKSGESEANIDSDKKEIKSDEDNTKASVESTDKPVDALKTDGEDLSSNNDSIDESEKETSIVESSDTKVKEKKNLKKDKKKKADASTKTSEEETITAQKSDKVEEVTDITSSEDVTKDVVTGEIQKDFEQNSELKSEELNESELAEVEKLIQQIESENNSSNTEEEVILIETDDDSFEFIELSDYKKALNENKSKNNKPGNKPVRRKNGMNKAKEMLLKAEETVKGGDDK